MARIMVVDDEPDLRFILRKLLERAGHEVVEAAEGAAALEMIADSPPDLLVTDMMMPGMGGADLIRALRADPVTADLPVLVVTGYSVQEEFTPDVVVLVKPYHLKPLLPAVNELLARKTPRG